MCKHCAAGQGTEATLTAFLNPCHAYQTTVPLCLFELSLPIRGLQCKDEQNIHSLVLRDTDIVLYSPQPNQSGKKKSLCIVP
ncbi:hypothetical protein GDO86_009256 [Hymenochirus boettgeri]|uniref:Uncharacterized protein n=1 Tax=Hymenochirus boettgeri TaxID=247094 RepID=A0A8T2JKZ7_9PIPI|nr:hypothetical protein GDO86_009256 [Hymenochirus boettgeri]